MKLDLILWYVQMLVPQEPVVATLFLWLLLKQPMAGLSSAVDDCRNSRRGIT